ncbi:hypothetical protein CJZ71_17280 [Bacillus subtilis]|nr:hypothetical protein S101441_01038 [Bacillus subtilis subsp. subtilis]ASV03731.1 hypothetical protein CJZ71_17280 [Bacillus subtilis]AYK69809.1 hypothetical protein D9C09_08705 [Bacillus subtilis subsp. subtilis]AYK73506.1 hypothetical protein D9C12_06490 [Bacillus subtilis subsp. subtilis]AYL00468.1 hypothetical protein D9C08_08555 [Bacillus subtilis subsp. subtilis]
MGALFLHLKPDEYLKKLYKTKKLVEKTSFSLQAEKEPRLLFILTQRIGLRSLLTPLQALLHLQALIG